MMIYCRALRALYIAGQCWSRVMVLLLLLVLPEIFLGRSRHRTRHLQTICNVGGVFALGWGTLVVRYGRVVFHRLEGVHIDPNTRPGRNGGSGALAGLVVLGAPDDVNLTLDDNAVEPAMVHELAGARALLWAEAEHRPEEGRDRLRRFARELVLVVQHVFERPEAEFVDSDMAQLACQACQKVRGEERWANLCG